MLLVLIGAAMAADPWLVDARPGRAFVPASLLSAKPTLRVQVGGLDASSVEIRHGDLPPCQVNGALVDLEADCGPLFIRPVNEGGWTITVGESRVLLSTDEVSAEYGFDLFGLVFPTNPGYSLALLESGEERFWVSDPLGLEVQGGFQAQRISEAASADARLVGVWSYNGTQALTWHAGAAAPTLTFGFSDQCPPAARDEFVVCYTVGAADPLEMTETSGVMRTNMALTVVVFGAPEGAEIQVGGKAALSAGRVDTGESIGKSQSGLQPTGPSGRIIRHFTPRGPGAVPIDLVVGDKKTPISELFVAEPVIAAVRMGVGVTNVVDAHYAPITAPGSATAEVGLLSADSFAPELVVGFAPFVFDRGGRVYAPGYDRRRLAPYVGLGLVSVDADDSPALTPLKSVYLGGELELIHSSSIAFTFVLRRVSRLPEPYQVGSPFSGSAVPTVSAYQPGVALVWNVSPAFFQVSQNPFSFLGNL